MSSWEKMQWLISQAKRNGYRDYFTPMKVGEKVGHNSHYRFMWGRYWWEALFGEQWREYMHKGLDIAVDEGPQAVIDYQFELKKGLQHAQKEVPEQSNAS